MKKLRQFLKFDHESFLKDKKFIVKETRPYFEYVNGEKTDKELGTTVVCLIDEDNTKYADDEVDVNLLETINFKVPGKQLDLAQKTAVKPAEIIKASVYGEFLNKLSIECARIVKIDTNATQN